MYEYPNPPAVPDFLIEQRKNPANKSAAAMRRILERYEIDSGGVKTPIEITEIRRRPYYRVVLPDIGVATQCMLSSLRERLLDSFQLGKQTPLTPRQWKTSKQGSKKKQPSSWTKTCPTLTPRPETTSSLCSRTTSSARPHRDPAQRQRNRRSCCKLGQGACQGISPEIRLDKDQHTHQVRKRHIKPSPQGGTGRGKRDNHPEPPP